MQAAALLVALSTAAPALRLHAFNTGSVRAPAGFVAKGSGWFHRRTMDFPAFVLEHPTQGLIVFDAGLPPELAEHPGRYMGHLNHFLAPFKTAKGQDLASQMRRAGLDPAKVRWVIFSHRHFDHTGSIASFPNAAVVLSRRELEAAHGKVKGDKNRTPPPMRDFDHMNLRLVEFSSAPAFGTFEHGVDLLGDGSLMLLDASGHTAGSMAAWANTGGDGTLLTGDASWTQDNWQQQKRQYYAWDMNSHLHRLAQIKQWKEKAPGLLVLPGHDLSAARGTPILHE